MVTSEVLGTTGARRTRGDWSCSLLLILAASHLKEGPVALAPNGKAVCCCGRGLRKAVAEPLLPSAGPAVLGGLCFPVSCRRDRGTNSRVCRLRESRAPARRRSSKSR